jgi:hypothetical protein
MYLMAAQQFTSTATLGRRKADTPNVRFEVLIAVTMKNAVFWDVAPCGSS